ncbi:MAG: hypothetical protein ACREQ5_17100 [Candidatus Dormibacteria bacterium]
MPVTRVPALAGLTLLLASCGNAAVPPTPSPSFTYTDHGAYVTLHYEGYPETAKARGSCQRGYVQTDPHLGIDPGADFRCVYNSSSDDPIQARIGVGYPFWLGIMHCGLEYLQFDHRLFVPDTFPGRLDYFGTMTLMAPGHARLVDPHGDTLTLHAVDSVTVPLCM